MTMTSCQGGRGARAGKKAATMATAASYFTGKWVVMPDVRRIGGTPQITIRPLDVQLNVTTQQRKSEDVYAIG
jgi:hypothetical protein